MSFTRWLVSVCLWLVLFGSAVAAQTASDSVGQAPGAKLNIIIERQLVRFTTLGEAVEWRLVVTNQQEEVIFDSGLVYGHTLEWSLKNQQDEAVQSGLYAYSLTTKAVNDEAARTQRGHLIIDRASNSDRVWVTSTQAVGIGSEAPQVSVVGSREVTVGGAELPATAPRREVSTPRDALPQRANAETANENRAAPTAPAGTANRVAKFAADGTSLIDSAITEVSGNVGIGVTNPQSGLDYRHSSAPFFTRDIGTTNFGTPQSALQLGVTNLGSRNVNVGPSFLFFADNSAGAKSFLGRVSGAWENPTAGAETGAILFQTRASSGDTGASTERMRITAGGNVGIGTATPFGPLHVHHSGSYTPIFLSTGSGPQGAARFRLQADSGLSGQGRSFVIYDDDAAQYRLVINAFGYVGLGTTTPAARLQVIANNYGIGAWVSSQNGPGLRATSVSSNAIEATSTTLAGVSAGGYIGVQGNTIGTQDSQGVRGENGGSNTVGYAGYFNGRTAVVGNLIKGGGSFKIDHPLDPENRYLYHSFVESPDMKNIYDGVIITDELGEATVTLPDYFAALNRDFRYQLTVIGQFAQAIVSGEIKDNRFTIKTDKANVKVSWQVTGIRQDAYANANRIPVEENKPEPERGHYLHPQAFGQSEEKSVEWARHPELMRQTKERREQMQQKLRPSQP
jgi:hypothetical protein